MTSLAEALEFGQGVERPFQCEKHDDRNASASVNVLKGVWYCYGCGARGAADAKKAPSLDALAAMIEPEKACRVYPETYLELYTDPGYWLTRFPDWLCWVAGLGQDPVTGQGVFPVRTPEGRLAGVGRRTTDSDVAYAKLTGGNPSRYKYPYRWSAAQSLGRVGRLTHHNVLVLVEGYADAVALAEIGIPAACAYGSSLHYPQIEYVLRHKPEIVLLGMDSDEAGQRGKLQSHKALRNKGLDLAIVDWPKKDPGECTTAQRLEAVESVVGTAYRADWDSAVANMQAAYHREIEAA